MMELLIGKLIYKPLNFLTTTIMNVNLKNTPKI